MFDGDRYGHFNCELSVTPLNGGSEWRVNEDFVWHIGHKGSNFHVLVPKGFIYDLASVPAMLRPLIPNTTSPQASAVHDFGYRHNQVYVVMSWDKDTPIYYPESVEMSRAEWDDAFYKGMLVRGVSRLRAWSAYKGVRLGGRWPWNSHRKRNEKWSYRK